MGDNYYSLKVNQAYQAISSITGDINSIVLKKQSVDMTRQLENEKKQYQSFFNAAEQNPADFDNIMAEFNQFKEEQSAKAVNSFSHPQIRRLYEQSSQQNADAAAQGFKALQTKNMVNDGRVTEKSLIEDMIDQAPFDPEAFKAYEADMRSKVSGLQFYTKAEGDILFNNAIDASQNKALMAGAKAFFDNTPGSYTQKGDAARNWLSSPEGAQALKEGGLSADQFEKMGSMINSWENEAYTRQTRLDNESNSAYDDSARSLYFDSLQSGDTSDFIDFLFDKSNNPPDDRLPMYWLGQLQKLDKDDPEKFVLNSIHYEKMAEIAHNETKDERWKVNQWHKYWMEQNLPASEMNKYTKELETRAAHYQNPAFKSAIDIFTNQFGEIKKKGSTFDGAKGDQLELMYQTRLNSLYAAMEDGSISPDRIQLMATNLNRELIKDSIEIELQDTSQSLQGMNLFSMETVKDFTTLMGKMEQGQLVGVGMYYKEDLHQFETVYDKIFENITSNLDKSRFGFLEEHGAKVLSFSKETGLYDQDGKPMYLMKIDDDGTEREFLVQARSDETLRYWKQTGPKEGQGEWVDLGYSQKGLSEAIDQTGVVEQRDIAAPFAGTPREDITTETLKAAGNQSVKEAEVNPYAEGVKVEDEKDSGFLRGVVDFFRGRK